MCIAVVIIDAIHLVARVTGASIALAVQRG